MITQNQLKAALHYSAQTGVFTRAISAGNRALAGSVAGCPNGTGYVLIRLLGHSFRAHRLAWLYVHGEWPEHDIDHINGDRSDNRLVNLRSVSRVENSKNARRNTRNTSGVIGVTWQPRYGAWASQIVIAKKCISLGCSMSKLDAAALRKSSELRYGFHANHSR